MTVLPRTARSACPTAAWRSAAVCWRTSRPSTGRRSSSPTRRGCGRRRATTSRPSPLRHAATSVHFAAKALPCAPVMRLLAARGSAATSPWPASWRSRWRPGSTPRACCCTATPSATPTSSAALAAGVGLIVIDGPDDVDRLARLAPAGQAVLLRVNPGVPGRTHAAMDTGAADSKFGVALADAPALLDRIAGTAGARAARPARAHRLAAARPRRLRPRRRGARRPRPLPRLRPRRRPRHRLHAGRRAAVDRRLRRGHRRPPCTPSSTRRRADRRARPLARRPLDGDALLRRDGQARRAHPRRGGRRDGRQPRADALRPALRAARSWIASARRETCELVGHHCESGDVLAPAWRSPRRPWATSC